MSKQTILVVGGAGYIGSHMILSLQQAGYQPIILDNLVTGHRESTRSAELIIGDMGDRVLLANLFKKYTVDAVIHFASFSLVGESVQEPAKYYQNNVSNTLVLLEQMLKAGVKKFIFSSTAAVYGEPLATPINETHPCKPINPYGKSKVMVEQILQDYAVAYHLQSISLRYFNAAGAHPNGNLCELHNPETHLIPLVLEVAQGLRSHITIYGNDYLTPDGTCIRDYIHVNDLCAAHLCALKALEKNNGAQAYNLGSGTGYSVQAVIDVAKQVTQREIKVEIGKRRAGDPAILLADPTRAMQTLNWQPKTSDLTTIIKDAWHAMQHHSKH